MSNLSERQFPLCGAQIDALTRGELITLIDEARVNHEKLLILNHNLHSLYLYFTNKEFRSAYQNASYTYVDGLPVIWIGKAAGFPVSSQHRITFLDSFDYMLSEAENRGWRIFYLGSTQEVLERGLSLLHQRYPRLTICGHNGYFPKLGPGSDAVANEINDFRPDILFVGMGMPIQELWLANHGDKLRAAAILTSGATLDYVTGNAYRPPAWAGKLGLYGVCRMLSDPKRLWRRYLVEPAVLARYLLPDVLKQRFARRESAKPKPACWSPINHSVMGQTMRICLMNDHYYRSSGVAIAIRRIAEAAPADVEYWFAGCGTKEFPEDLSWISAGRYRCFDLKNSNPVRILAELFRLKAWLKQHQCELVHCHHRRVAALLQLAGIPVLYTGQLAFPYAAWYRLLGPRFSTAITPSVAENLIETTGRKPIACIGNPASFPDAIPETNLERVRNRAVCIGRLEPVKGHTHLLSAWKILYDRGYRYELYLVGEGSLRTDLVAQVKRDGIENLIHFCGFTNNISTYVDDSLFAILASEVEGQGIVTLEAAGLGKASILTAVTGSIDLLPPNRTLPNGVPYGDPIALADAIEQWFLDPEEVVREGGRFFRFLKASSDPHDIAQGYRRTYKQVLARLTAAAS